MKYYFLKAITACAAVAVSASVHAQTGFTKPDAANEKTLEEKFDQLLNRDSIKANIQELSSEPHHLGSPGGKRVAEAILQKFKNWGWDAHIEEFKVLFPTPRERELELVSPTSYKAVLEEVPVDGDPSTSEKGALPPYNAWSADGDVTGGLIFVNYGLPEDYEYLDKLGVSVKGKIVIAKYGRSWRGIKGKVAQEHGAIGTIIYSDPADDGYTKGDVYPTGPYKNEYGVQRGSVMDMVLYPGDPLTPGIGATADAKRLDRKDAKTILKIPVLPISYHDALPLLKALDGAVAPAGWSGTLPITYHIGTGDAQVHLKAIFNWDMVPAYDVVATMKGSVYPDEWIIRGNHHDAWVNGAGDPISGQAALLEEAKAIGILHKNGWNPKRTLVYVAWDGEEPSLIGSTEWAETHGDELQKKAVAYINSDGSDRGFLSAGGSAALSAMVAEVADGVKDPVTDSSVLARRMAARAVSSAAKGNENNAKPSFTLEALGSGSDFSSFLQHLGIPTLDFGFGGEGNGGEYHTLYDTYTNYFRFKDPGLYYGKALSETVGHTVLRLSEADLLPFDFRTLYKEINNYVEEVTAEMNNKRESYKRQNNLLASGDYRLAADTAKHLQLPQAKGAVPYLDFSPLENVLQQLASTTDSLNISLHKTFKSNQSISKQTNEALYRAEQQLLLTDGLPRRPWYRHALYAPGFYTGYSVKTIPGVREAIDQDNWKEAQEQIKVLADALNKFNDYLKNIPVQ